MALRDTNWITEAHFIETKQTDMQEVITINYGTTSVRRRTTTIVDGEWIVLTEAAARAYSTAHAGDTNTILTALEDNRYCGAWKLTSKVTTRGTYVVDT